MGCLFAAHPRAPRWRTSRARAPRVRNRHASRAPASTVRRAETGGADRLVGCLLSALDGQLTPEGVSPPTLSTLFRFRAAWRQSTFTAPVLPTLSAAGVASDNSPTRAMSSIECSVMYLE